MKTELITTTCGRRDAAQAKAAAAEIVDGAKHLRRPVPRVATAKDPS